MSNGYSYHDEIEKLFFAVKALSHPGELLYSRSQVALDRYRDIKDHAQQCHALDRLRSQLSAAIFAWAAEVDPRQGGRR